MASRRRSFLAGATSAITATLAGCGGDGGDTTNDETETPTPGGSPTDAAVESSFPQFQYDAANTGAVPDVTGPTDSVSSAFAFGGAGVELGHDMGAPALDDGTVYVTEGSIDENDNAKTVVYALDAVDGTIEWEQPFEGTNGAGSTAVTDDLVLALVSGTLYALDRQNGAEAWSVESVAGGGVAVTDETVYLASSGFRSAEIRALSLADGTERWTQSVERGTLLPMPAVADGTVYVSGSALQALDAATGDPLWTASPERDVTTPPTVTGDTVLAGTEAELRAYSTADGSESWHSEIEGNGSYGSVFLGSPLAVADGSVYVSSSWTLSAYDIGSGDRQYRIETGVDGTPVVADGRLYLTGLGELACFSAADGSKVWSYGTEQSSASGNLAPAVADGVAYFPAETLYAIRG